jgi:hypothetical protein
MTWKEFDAIPWAIRTRVRLKSELGIFSLFAIDFEQRLVELQTGNTDGRVSGRVVHCSEILEVLP